MRSGALAQRTGLSRDIIRFYERERLVESESGPASTNDDRDDPEDLVDRLRMIRDARSVGFSVPDLGCLVHLRDSLQDGPTAAKRYLGEKAGELHAVIRGPSDYWRCWTARAAR